MKFGVMFASTGHYATGEGAAAIATAADECGIESIWAVEHVVIPHGYQSQYPYHESGRIPGGEDPDLQVLELILTAPMVVASWISLQYFGSTVDNAAFGAGDKTLHNVCGRVGVLEGNGGDLRVGLPLQSVHDGQGFVHEPVRLSVFIAAAPDAISTVLARQPQVRALLDNRWLFLFALDDRGQTTHRYAGDLAWEAL